MPTSALPAMTHRNGRTGLKLSGTITVWFLKRIRHEPPRLPARFVLDAVHRQPPVQGARRACSCPRRTCISPPTTAAKVLDGTSGLWCVNAGHGRTKIVEAIQKQAGVLDYAPPFSDGASAAVQGGGAPQDPDARRSRLHVLHQLGLGIGRHRAEDRAGLPSRARRRQPPLADRARARLSRRGQFRRHVGRRHARPTARRSAACCPRSIISRTRTTSSKTRSRAASRRGARISPTNSKLASSRCTTRPTSRRSSSSRWRARPACSCRRKAISKVAPDLRQARHPADIRRGHHRLRPPRRLVRMRKTRRHSRHHLPRQGPDQRQRCRWARSSCAKRSTKR